MKKDTDNTMFYGASPTIFKYAEELRKNQTPSEEILWDELKGKKLGVKFRRQHPINNYIADFYCHKLRLVIEIDGGYHTESEQKNYDKFRSDDLKEFGILVIRFANDKIISELENVIDVIKQRIANTAPYH